MRKSFLLFRQRPFAGQHDAGEAEPAQGVRPGPVVDGQLGAGVQLQFGEVLAGDAVDAQVLEDNGIDADIADGGEVLDQFGQLFLLDQRVDGHEDSPARLETVGVGHHLGQLVERKVLGLGTGGELLEAQVDGVGPVMEGGEGCFGPAGGSQQLDRFA